jgi:hypothetical protein
MLYLLSLITRPVQVFENEIWKFVFQSICPFLLSHQMYKPKVNGVCFLPFVIFVESIGIAPPLFLTFLLRVFVIVKQL